MLVGIAIKHGLPWNCASALPIRKLEYLRTPPNEFLARITWIISSTVD